jgi:hypothetical protein
MSRPKNKICASCNIVFKAKLDAKTCSARCRKQLQRANKFVAQAAQELEREVRQTEEAAQDAIERVAVRVVPSYATQGGFVGDTAGVQTKQPIGHGSDMIIPPRVQGSPWGANSVAMEDLALQPELQATSYGAPTGSVIEQMLDSSSIKAEKPGPRSFASVMRQTRRRLVTGALLLIGCAGLVLAFVLLPKNNGQNQQALSTSAITTPQLIGESLKLNINTSVVNGKEFLATGPVLIQNELNSPEAFRIQNSAGNNLLLVDTQNNTINIGNQPPGNVSLHVNGDITTNGALVSTGGSYSLDSNGLNIGGVLVCTARGCISSNSPAPTPANPTIDVANLAYLDMAQTFTGAKGLRLDSTKAFQVQDTAGTSNTFVVDSTNGVVGIGLVPINGLGALQVAGAVNASNGFEANGVAGSNFTCPAGQLLQQAVIAGGLITSGSCVVIAGGTTPELQQVYDASMPASVVLSNASGVLQIQDAASPLATNLFEVTNNGAATKYFAVNNLGISVTGNINTTGQYQVGGSQISSANLSNDANLAKLNGNQTFSGNNTFSSVSNSFTGSGAGLTSLNAGNVSSGTLSDTRLSGNVTLAGNAFNGASQLVQNTNGGILPVLSGANLTNLNASNISSGTLNDAHLTNNVALLNRNGQTFTGNNQLFQNASNSTTAFQIQNVAGSSNLFIADTTNTRVAIARASASYTLDVGGDINTTGVLRVSGIQISSANLSNDANLAKLGANQSFSGNNTFSSASNSFTGDGSGLSNLNATNVSSGTLNDSHLSNNVALLNAYNNFQNTSNSTTAFQVQNALGNNILTIDTTNGLAAIGKASALNADLLFYNSGGSGNIALQTANPGASSFTITLPAATGTVCLTSGNCAGVGGTGDILNNGNSFSSAVTLGTNDNFGLNLRTNGHNVATLSNSGAASFQNFSNSTSAFQIQNAAGTSNLFIADTTNSRIAINQASAAYPLDVAGDINSTTGLRVGGVLVCTSSGCTAGSGSGSYIQNGTATQTNANFNIRSAAIGSVAAVIEGANGQTADLLDVQSFNGTTKYVAVTVNGISVEGNVNTTGQYQVNGTQISSANLSNDSNLAKVNGNTTFSGNNTFSSASNSFTGSGAGLSSLNASNISSGNLNDSRLSANVALLNGTGPQIFSGNNKFTGTVLSQNASNSTAALQVQNALGNEILTADTTNAQVVLGKSSSLNAKLVFSNSANADQVTIQPAASQTANYTLQLPALAAGSYAICTDSGNCNGAGATLQTAYNNSTSPEITLNASNGALTIWDASTALGANLFEVQSNGGGSTYFGVTASGTSTTGSSVVSGNINTTGGGLQTNSTTRVDNSGNLTNIGNLTTTGASTLTAGGANGFTFKPTTNSTNSFEIQNANATAHLLVADTTNSRIAINQTSANYTLDVAGDINTSTGFRVGGTAGSSVTCSSGNVVQNAVISGGIITSGTCVANGGGIAPTFTQVYGNGANQADETATLTSGRGGLVIQDASTPIGASLFTVQNNGGATKFINVTASGVTIAGTATASGNINTSSGQYQVGGTQISSANLSNDSNLAKLNGTGPQTFTGNNKFTGVVLSQNASNSTAAFQIQNAAGSSNLLIADTTNTRLAVAQASAAYTLDVGGDINTTTGFRVGGTAGSSVTCSSGNVVQNTVISGGIITSGTCVANGGGYAPTFNNVYTNGSSSTDETATLTSGRGGLVIQDASSPIGASLFTIQNNGGSTKFLDVTSSGISVAGSAVASGNINTTGGVLQTNGATRIDNSGNLTNIGNFTATAGTTFLTTGANGFTFKPGTDNVTAFQVQNANGTSLLTADTLNTRLTLNADSSIGLTSASSIFSDNFESGSFLLWGSYNNSAGTMQTGTVHNGKYAMQFNPGGGSWSYVSTNIDTGGSTAFLRAWVNISSQSSATLRFMGLDNGGGNGWTWNVWRNNSGQVCINNTGASTTDCGGSLTTGAWHLVELQITSATTTTGTTNLWLDGANVYNQTTSNNGTSTQLQNVYVGENTVSGIGTGFIDDVSVSTARNSVSSSLNVDDTLSVGGSTNLGGDLLVKPLADGNALRVTNGSGNTIFNVSSSTVVGLTGATTIKTATTAVTPYSDNNAVFQIQNASGFSMLNVDTTSTGTTNIGSAATNVGAFNAANTSFPTTPVLDNFNRANTGPPPSANWSQGPFDFTGGEGLQLSSNAIIRKATGSYRQDDYWNPTTFGPDSEVYTTASTVGASDEIDLYLRGTSIGSGTSNGYLLNINFSGNIWSLSKVTGGASTSLGNNFTQAISSGDSVGFSARGTNITAWYKASGGSWKPIGTASDGIYSTAGNIGIGIAGTGGTVLDNFGGGTQGSGLSVDSTGKLISKNITDSTAAFQVQNAAGNNYLLINTSGASVSVGDTGIASTIQIGNTTGVVAQTINIGNNSTASSSTTLTLGSTIGASSTTINAGSGGISLGANTTVATNKSFTANGLALFQDATNSTTALQVQNSTGTQLLNADTTNLRVSVGSIGTATGQLFVGGKLATAATGSVSIGSAPERSAIQGHYAYVTNFTGNTLQIIDVTNPASPTTISSTSTGAGTNPDFISIKGNYAYITMFGTNTLQIWNIANANTPTNVGNLQLSTVGNIKAQGRYAYIVGTALMVVDISNPASPALVKTLALGATLNDLAVSGNYVYLVGTDHTIKIVDISNPAAASLVSSTATGFSGGSLDAFAITVQGRYAFISNYATGNIQVLDVSNPATPTSVTSISTTNPVNQLILQGHLLYALEYIGNRFQVFDVTNPASLSNLGSVNTDVRPSGASASGRYLYVTNETTGSFQVFDLGGAYLQQLEAGAAEFGTLNVDNNASFAGDASIMGGLNVGSSLQAAGNISSGGNLFVQGSTSFAGGILGGTTISALSTPAAPTVTSVGANANTVTWSYTVTAVSASGGETLASSAGSVSASDNSTLTSSNYNQLTWNPVIGAVNYKLYRTVSGGTPSSTGLIGTSSSLIFNDTGIAAAGSSPTVNTTGNLTVNSSNTVFKPTTNSTTAFQVQNSSGTQLLNVDSTNSRIGIDNTYTAMSAPTQNNTSTSTSGGTLAATTYYYKITAIDSAGGETTPSAEKSQVTTGAASTVTLSWVPVTGASGYKLYRGTTGLGGSGSEVYLTTTLGTVNGANLNYIDTGAITVGAATPPVTNTAYTSTNNSNSSLQLSIGGNGTPTGQLYVSGSLPKDISAGGVKTASGPDYVYVQGRYAYVADQTGNKLQVFDVSNPASPVDLTNGGVTTGVSPTTVYVQGHYAYLTDLNANKLQVFDVSNPASPVDVSGGGASTGGGSGPLAVYVQGRYAYVTTEFTTKILVFDVSNPASPVDVSGGGVSTGALSLPTSIYVSGHYAYVTDTNISKLQVFDVSNPASPVDVSGGGVSTGSGTQNVYVSGRYAYVADSSAAKLQVFDLGGTYTQQLEAGGTETGTLQVDSNGQVAGDFNIQGALSVGQSMSINGNLSVSGKTSALTVQNGVDTANALQVQNMAGTSIFDVSTISANQNLLTNPSFESNTAGWTTYSGNETTFAASSSNAQTGIQSLNVITPATSTNDGAKYTYYFRPNTTYTFSVYALDAVSFSKFDIGANVNGSDVSCNVSGNNLTINGNLTRFRCTFTTGATTTASDYVFLRRNSGDTATARSMFFDAAQLEIAGSASAFADQPYPNLISNSSLENNLDSWSVKGTATISASGDFAQFGNRSLKVVTPGTTGTGAQFTVPLAANSSYSISFWAKASSGSYNIVPGRQDNGSDSSCASTYTLTTTWTKFSCSFTTGGTVNTTTNIYIKDNGTSHTFYIDGITLVAGGVAQDFVQPAASLQANPLYGNLSLNSSNVGEIQPWVSNVNQLPGPRFAISPVYANNGYMYVLGGLDASLTSSSTVYYAKVNADGSIAAWTTSGTPLPLALDGVSTAVSNGYIYAIGGEHASSVAQNSVYYAKLNADGSTGSWQTNSTPLPQARAASGVFVANGYIYSIGGFISAGNSSAVVYYAKLNSDGSTGVWQTTSSLPGTRYHVSTAASNGYVYVVGGNNTGSTGSNTAYYAAINKDGTLGSWSTGANTLPYIVRGASAATANGYIYASGGRDNSNNYLSSVTYAKLNSDGSMGVWNTSSNSVPAAEAYSYVAPVVNGYMYFIGGVNASVQSTVYYTSASRILVSGSLDLVGLSGQSLSDGGSGGSLTAGNTQVVGTLNVQDQASFNSSVSISGNIYSGGSLGVSGGANITGSTNLNGGLNQLAVPGVPTVTPQGTTGAQRWDYTVTAVNAYGGETTASTAGTTATGSATLDSTNFNRLTWSAVTGATSYKIYRTFATGGTPSTIGLVGSTTSATLDDIGFTAGNSSPTTDTTGQLTVQGSSLFKNTTNSTTAFQVQNAAGTNIITADTSNRLVAIGSGTAPSTTLQVSRDNSTLTTDWQPVVSGVAGKIGSYSTITQPTNVTGVLALLPTTNISTAGSGTLAWNFTNKTLTWKSGSAVTISSTNNGSYLLPDGSGGDMVAVVTAGSLPSSNQSDSLTVTTSAATAGFGDSGRNTARGSAIFNGSIYLGTENDTTDEGEVWRSADGVNWVKAAQDSFGQGITIDHVDSFIVYNGYLYAGTDIGQIWRTQDGTLWTQATVTPGATQNITDFSIFGGYLYANQANTPGNGQVYRTIDGVNWTNVFTYSASQDKYTHDLSVFQGRLYSDVGSYKGNLGAGAGAIYSTANGTSWTQSSTDGFGNSNNTDISALTSFNGYLYAGTFNATNGAEIWRTADGVTWQKVVTGGFGSSNVKVIHKFVVYNNYIYASTEDDTDGGRIYRSSDGINWSLVNVSGFGVASESQRVRSMFIFQGFLNATTENDDNGHGIEIWRLQTGTISDTSGGLYAQSLQVGNVSLSDRLNGLIDLQSQNGTFSLLNVTSSLQVGGSLGITSASSTAFQIQSFGGINLLTADASGLIVTISGNATSFASLTLNNVHFKSTQTNAPTIGTPTNCATTPTAAVTASSTDSAGSFTITAGTGGGYTTCDTVFTFNKAYGAAPKSIILQPTTAVGSATGLKNAQVSATSTTTFTVKLTSNPSGDSEVNGFYYWVVE